MSKPEQAAWDALRPILAGADLDPRRVENVVGPGHPDVNYCGGDIELKAMADFPVRVDTAIKVPEFTGEQAGWLLKRQEAGGRAWLLVRVGQWWFLFDALAAHQIFKGELTQEEWRQRSTWYGTLSDKLHRAWLIAKLKGVK